VARRRRRDSAKVNPLPPGSPLCTFVDRIRCSR
jgi:hypothetical protein